MNLKIGKIDIIILCGGRGKRIKKVSKGKPKVLLEVDGKPFIDILIDYFFQQGLRRFILSLGYSRECIKKHFRSSNYNVVFSEEDYPRGTAGAIKRAELFVKSPFFFVANGDSICSLNLKEFYDFHVKNRGIMSMALAKAKKQEDYGIVRIDDSKRVISFREKTENKKNLFINAGIYLMKKDIFKFIPEDKEISVEYDIIPKILDRGCYGYITNDELIDIGTPCRYKQARRFLLDRNFI